MMQTLASPDFYYLTLRHWNLLSKGLFIFIFFLLCLYIELSI